MKKLYRSTNNKMLAGVAAGIANYFGIDPVVVRLVMLFLFVITGFVPVAILYVAAVILVPEEVAHDIHP